MGFALAVCFPLLLARPSSSSKLCQGRLQACFSKITQVSLGAASWVSRAVLSPSAQCFSSFDPGWAGNISVGWSRSWVQPTLVATVGVKEEGHVFVSSELTGHAFTLVPGPTQHRSLPLVSHLLLFLVFYKSLLPSKVGDFFFHCIFFHSLCRVFFFPLSETRSHYVTLADPEFIM